MSIVRVSGIADRPKVFHRNLSASWRGGCGTAKRLAVDLLSLSMNEVKAYRRGLRPCFVCYPERRRHYP